MYMFMIDDAWHTIAIPFPKNLNPGKQTTAHVTHCWRSYVTLVTSFLHEHTCTCMCMYLVIGGGSLHARQAWESIKSLAQLPKKLMSGGGGGGGGGTPTHFFSPDNFRTSFTLLGRGTLGTQHRPPGWQAKKNSPPIFSPGQFPDIIYIIG